MLDESYRCVKASDYDMKTIDLCQRKQLERIPEI